MREAFRRIGAMILALCLLVSMLSVAVLAEDGTDITGTIQFTVSGYSGVYDGEAHSISVNVTSPEGASVSYAYPTEGEYGSQNPAFTNAGEYKVAYMIAKESYATQTDIATVAIERADVSEAVESTLPSSFTYDGNPVQLAPFHEGIESWEMAYCDADETSLSDAPSDPGSYSVKISGYGANYYAHVDHSFTIDEPETEIEYSVEGFDVDYDGKPHSISLTVSTEGVTVSYATSYEGPYGETNPSFTEAGMYVVYYRLERQGYKSEEGSVTVEIHAIDISDDVKATLPGSFTCTGAPVQFNLPTDKIQEWSVEYYQGDLCLESAPSVPGSYTATISGESGNYRASISHSFTIVEAEALPVIQYSVSSYSGYYDGKAHTIALNIATEGVTATYATSEDGAYSAALPSFTETGTYTVWFKLEKAGYETVVDFATVTIMELGKIEYSVQDYSGYDDGEAHSITLNVITEGVTATFATSEGGEYSADMPSFTDIGTYTVWFKLEKEGYETVVDSATVTIAKPGTILYTVEDYSGYYDGKPHSISLNVLTEGVDVTYSEKSSVVSKTLPMFTDPGYYIVRFLLEKVGYATTYGTGSVTIDPGVIEYSARGYSGYADGKAHSIQLYVSTPDAKVSYATSEGGEYSADKPSFSEVGTHTVWYRIEKEHYATVEGSEVVKLLQPKQDSIVYSVEDYVGAYDGEAHTIALDVTTPNVNVTYATSRDGEYGATLPSFTEPGTHTVWFRLKKSGYETSTGSATVTIEKAEQVLYFEQSVKTILPSKDSEEIPFVSHCLCHDQGDGALSWSFSDPDRMSLRSGNLFWGTLSIDVPYAEWSKGYSATVTATAAETDHYKAATATLTIVAISSIQAEYSASSGSGSAADVMHYMSKQQVTNQMQETIQMQDIDLTVSPVSTLDNQSLLSASNELRKKLMASAGAGQIGSMAVDATLIDTQTGAELHSTNGDLTLSLTGDLQRKYQENYKEMDCIAVHLKQDSTPFLTVNIRHDSTAPAEQDVRYNPDTTSTSTDDSTVESYDFTMPTGGVTADSSFAPTTDSTAAPTDDPTAAPQGTSTNGQGVYIDSSSFNMDGGTIDTSGANADGSGVYVDSSGFTIDGGNINTATTGNSNSSLIGNTGNGIGGGNSGEGSNIQISSGNVSAAGNTGNGIGGGNSGEGSNIQISGGSVKGNAGTSAPRPNDPAEDPTGTQVYKTEVNLDVNNGLNGTGNNSELNVSYLRIQEGLRNNAGLDDNSSASSNEGQLLVQRGDLTVVPTGSLSPTVEYIPCKLTENGVIVSDTSLSPFLLIYGPKEAFSNLLTVRAKDGVFTYDGEGHAVAAEPSIAEGTTLYYSLDLETWQTEAPSFTDVRWNEDGSVGSYQVYVLAENPDCDPAVCSYTVTILPEA